MASPFFPAFFRASDGNFRREGVFSRSFSHAAWGLSEAEVFVEDSFADFCSVPVTVFLLKEPSRHKCF
jgi:hypothetical protein